MRTSNPTELQIRDARTEERSTMRALTLAAYEEYATIMPLPAWVGLRGAIINALDTESAAERIVALQDGVLVGSVMLFPPQTDAYGDMTGKASHPELRLLAVVHAARGQGVGRALTEACIARARQMGATELGLHTSDSLQAAIRLYERMGFTRAPDRDFQPAPGTELVKGYRFALAEPN
jgi:ribosomal protein S18 acetylase RimI-like enzyme